MNKAVFLDRDGIINREKGNYTFREEDFEILPGVGGFLAKLKKKGYLLIIISNQSGIAKGIYAHADTERLHGRLQEYLAPLGAQIDEFYYCPHHPVHGLCLCRKPGSLLLEKAMARFEIDPQQSFFIGDMERDMEAGKGAGVNCILLPPNPDMRKAQLPEELN